MQDIHDIRPPIQVGFDPMLFKIILMVLGGIILVTLLFFLIKKYLKKRKQPEDLKYLPPPIPPYETALKTLELLFQREILDPRLFYFDLTAVLKKYISFSFNINAIEMTSQEFVKHITQLDIDKQVKKDISNFQNKSDPFKYAGLVPQKNQVKDDILFIKERIYLIEKDLVKLKEKEEGDQ